MLDKNVVEDELIFIATNSFFTDMTKEDIKCWDDICKAFVYNDLSYILCATVQVDEKTAHVHCVVVLLIKKYDKRIDI